MVCSVATGLSKGYGFVEFSSRDEAAQAKLQLATKVVGQRSIRVDFADNGMQTCEDLHSRTLFVDRLPKGFLDDDILRDRFTSFGIVNFCQVSNACHCDLMLRKLSIVIVDFVHSQVALTSSGASRGFAFIDMSTWQEAEAAQSSCNGASLSGHEMRVSFGMPCRPGACILQHKNSINIPFCVSVCTVCVWWLLVYYNDCCADQWEATRLKTASTSEREYFFGEFRPPAFSSAFTAVLCTAHDLCTL